MHLGKPGYRINAPLMQRFNYQPCISAAPAALDRYPCGFTGDVARSTRSIRMTLRCREATARQASTAISAEKMGHVQGTHLAALFYT